MKLFSFFAYQIINYVCNVCFIEFVHVGDGHYVYVFPTICVEKKLGGYMKELYFSHLIII